MTFEILEEFIVVQRGISNGVILFGRSVDNSRVLVGKTGEVYPVFLRIKSLYEPAFLDLTHVKNLSDSLASLAVIQSKALILSTHYDLIPSVIKGNSCDASRTRTGWPLQVSL